MDGAGTIQRHRRLREGAVAAKLESSEGGGDAAGAFFALRLRLIAPHCTSSLQLVNWSSRSGASSALLPLLCDPFSTTFGRWAGQCGRGSTPGVFEGSLAWREPCGALEDDR